MSLWSLTKRAEAIINPLLIVETLSKSSERYDRGQKFVEYQSLPSFREYVLLRQDVPEVYLQFREEPNLWRTSEAIGLESEVYFRSIEARISVADIYYEVQF